MKVEIDHLADVATYSTMIGRTTSRVYQLIAESERDGGPLKVVRICGTPYILLSKAEYTKSLKTKQNGSRV